ncbi:MAG: amino acid permease [Cyclobacteriaceae bacterium]|nr:amino acid permease [Cyclobacteriaceae bacterium]
MQPTLLGSSRASGLSRQLSLAGLTATGICSMIGASIYVVPFMIQRNVPGIGPHVVPAFLFAALPAILAAFAYAILASAMPRAGGSYIYASRGLHPYLGFVASFSQWFGLSIAIGVVSYVIIPFFRDIAFALQQDQVAAWLDSGSVRVSLSLSLLWLFVWINIRGIQAYERTLIPLMVLMFALGAVVIVVGYSTGQEKYLAHLSPEAAENVRGMAAPFDLFTFFSASAVLFSSFIGFDSIAQAGGEAKNPGRNLPLAIGLAVGIVGLFYLLFAGAVYHTVPWGHVAQMANQGDVTASGLMSVVLNPGWTIIIVSGAAVALINDLPAMLLSVSRLMFAWAEDGIFPKAVTQVHPRFKTPHIALLLSGGMASVGILGSHFAGDFFLGIDIMVTSMLINFMAMCMAVLVLRRRNPVLYESISVVKHRGIQIMLATVGIILLFGLLSIHVFKDLTSKVDAWYFHSTPVWLLVMLGASVLYFLERRKLRRAGVDEKKLFSTLPPE